ncbi:uncharacterized protein LOC114520357 [Dendronephthya gigantea]|uniref:uncharacterized protein LOC114520357 n=1 Tax=Dendronephthya gigantea TaxID=151771 RepID=UPI00106B7D82|nr:uncharacterized protein LOC114520357 [Dendronephthya gigantea]
MSSAKITSCGHIFHPSCLRRLIKHGTTTCPECRKSITGNDAGVEPVLLRIQATTDGKPKYEENKYTWFKDKFLDSRRKLKKDIYHKLKSFSWLCGAYGLTAANKIINRPHLFLTVKREVKHSEVFRQLQEAFSCDDPEEHFELLEEPERKPNFKRVANRCENDSSVGSKPSAPDASVEAVPGGRVLVYGDREWNPMRAEKGGLRVMGSGTLTMFCCKDKHHYALICSHVGCITDARRAQAAFKQEECIREIRGSLSFYKENAKKHKYYFENGSEENDNVSISFGNDNDESKRELGDFHNNHFDDECDILSVKISNGIKINCKVVDVPPPDWVNIWNELYERVNETPNVADPVKVVKISLSSTCHEGRIVATEFSYEDKEGELFHDTTVVKGDSGPFLHDGDSGALVCFFDKKKEKKVFAYGVFEVDQLSLPEGSTSNGPYAICLNLETSLEKLGFGEAGCFNVCSGESASNSSRCDIL